MPGTSPGMTRRVGRSDGSHPQGRRRPQPAPPLRPLHFPHRAPGAHSVIAWLRAPVRARRQSRRHDEVGGPADGSQHAGPASLPLPLIHFPQAPRPYFDTRLATRIRARRSRAVRDARSPAHLSLFLSRLVHFPQRRALRAHFPLSPLRPLGPEKEKGADTAFGPPPPFSGEGNRGSWADLASAMKRAGPQVRSTRPRAAPHGA